MNDNILGSEKISKLFLTYCIPAVISMILASVQSMIDGIFLGNFVGSNALASINIVQPFMQIIMGFSMILSVGSLSFMGRCLGKNNHSKAQDIFKTSYIVVILVSITIGLIGFRYSDKIALYLGANYILVDYVSEYIRIISLFTPIISLMFLFGFTDRIIGKPNFYLFGTILSLIVNISLNYFLIKVLNLGIRGAAIATGLSYLSAFSVVIWPMVNEKNMINIYKGKFDKSTILSTIYNGSSEGVVSLATAITSYIFNISFMQISGAEGVAAFTSINYISIFTTLIMFGISDGIGPIVSYNYGHKNIERVNQTLNIAKKAIIAFGIMSLLLLFICGKEIVILFGIRNPDIIEMIGYGSKIFSIAFLFSGFNIVYSGYFTAIGKANESIIIAGCRGILFVILGILILPKILGILGVWLTIPIAEIMTLIISIYLLKK